MAQIIVFNSGAVITADGENGEVGEAGQDGSAGGGGGSTNGSPGSGGHGGGGGEGGQIVLLYNKLTNSGTFTVTGGAAGDGGPSVSGTGWGQGTVAAASNGQAGSAGLTTLTQVTN